MILHVTWKDAVSVDAWTHTDEVEPTFHIIETVGMLLKEDDDTLVLGLNHDVDSDNWSCFIHIPKDLIMARAELLMGRMD